LFAPPVIDQPGAEATRFLSTYNKLWLCFVKANLLGTGGANSGTKGRQSSEFRVYAAMMNAPSRLKAELQTAGFVSSSSADGFGMDISTSRANRLGVL
jgi:hypothetical protein